MISETFNKLKTAAFAFTTNRRRESRKRPADRDLENYDDGMNESGLFQRGPPLKIPRSEHPSQPLGEQQSPNWLSRTTSSLHSGFRQVMSQLQRGTRKDHAIEQSPIEITLDDEPLPESARQPREVFKSKSSQSLTRPSLIRPLDDPDVVFVGQVSSSSKCSTIPRSQSKMASSHHSFANPNTSLEARKESRKIANVRGGKGSCKKPYNSIHLRYDGGGVHGNLYGIESIRLDEKEIFKKLIANKCDTNRFDIKRHLVHPNMYPTTSTYFKHKMIQTPSGPVVVDKLDESFGRQLQQRVEPKSIVRRDGTDDVQWMRTVNEEVEILEVKQKLPLLTEHSPRSRVPEVVNLDDTFEFAAPVPRKPTAGTSSLKTSPLRKVTYNSPYMNDNWLSNVQAQYKKLNQQTEAEIRLLEAEQIAMSAQRMKDIQQKLDRFALNTESVLIVEEVPDPLPELTREMVAVIEKAMRPNPPNEVLVDAFNLSIKRHDLQTLAGLNWLNDEVVNFYFTLLMERGKLDNHLSVYVCNTFFYPKLLKDGHGALKRWTRRVDIFAHALMLVPVHLGMHWCLAVVDFRHKKIEYYDSMGGSNDNCLAALKKYLEMESLDKKKVALDTSSWTTVCVKDIPQQLNGSDCGMFTCKYAEYISRDKKITFTQENMPYFRRRMVYEIVTKQLL